MSRFGLDVRDKVALVTGGAAGIGRATAETFTEAGYRVMVVDVDAEAAERTAAELAEDGAEAAQTTADVADEAQVAAAVAATVERWGRLDVVFNNAGISGRGARVENLDGADVARVLAVDLKASFYACKHAVPALRRSGGGSILNLASITAETGSAYYPAYGAAKAGVIALTRSLARRIGRYNIRINCISPGSIAGTNLMGGPPTDPEERRRQAFGLMKKIPLGRPGRPRDVAHMALFLASPLAAHVHGSVVTVDGGELLGFH